MLRRLLTVTLSCVLLLGCGFTRAISVPPEQLVLLNGSRTEQVGTRSETQTHTVGGQLQTTYHTRPVIESTTTHVITTDGRTKAISGPFDAVVHTADGPSAKFEHPVVSSIVDGRLKVHGAAQSPLDISLDRVERVDLIVPNSGAAGVFGVVILLLVPGLLLLVASQQ